MVGLGRPIRVCSGHVGVLDCARRCLGVNLDDVGELQSATHSGCAVCQMPQPRAFGSRPFRTLRKCHRRGCSGRFKREPYDDLYLGEWLDVWWQRLRHPFGRKGRGSGLFFCLHNRTSTRPETGKDFVG